MKFCGECGTPLQAASTTPDGEHRQLTVLFCDLVDSTVLSQRLDAEDLQSVVRAYQTAASEAISRWGGHIAQYLGDGLLVYFGYPQAYENAAERAVRAGLDIVTALENINATLETDHGVRLAARVGIHTGAVVIGAMGTGARTEILALGDTTNIAARVESMAKPNSVLITAATQQLVAGMFVIEDRGPQALKGIAEPTTLYNVLQPSGVRSRLAAAGGRLTQFVGREVEFSTLVACWEQAQKGKGQSVLVAGEAGIGKSRVVYQLHEHLATTAHTWLECGATPYTKSTPFYPIIAMLEQGLAFIPGDDDSEKLRKLEAALRELASGESVTLIADLLGLPTSNTPQLSPELQRRKTMDLLVKWTLTASATQPLIIFVEDLHWCDVSTQAYLEQVMEQSATAQILLVTTARPEFTPSWPERSNLNTIQLTRLTPLQAHNLVIALAGSAMPDATRDVLVDRADGVPLYLEELTKSAMEAGAGLGIDAIPASLADSLMARLDKLAGSKDIAQIAAVLGREFSYPLLAAITKHDEAQLRLALLRLFDAEILFTRGEPPTSIYTFKHALLQDAAYNSLLKRTRQQLHARAAQVLKMDFPERVESEPEVIARHFDRACMYEEAIAYYQRAGERAMQSSANEEAIVHLRRALELTARLPESGERDHLEFHLQIAIASPLTAARGWPHPENKQALERARELGSKVDDLPELPRVLAGMADAYMTSGEFATTLEIAQQTLIVAQRTGDAFDLVLAHFAMGIAHYWPGAYTESLAHFEQSIRHYDVDVHGPLAFSAGHDRGVAARSFAAHIYMNMGFPDRALALVAEAHKLARRINHPLSLGMAPVFASILNFECKNFDAMQKYASEMAALCAQHELPLWGAWAQIHLGRVRLEQDGNESHITNMQAAVDALASMGVIIAMPFFNAYIIEGLARNDQRQQALATLDKTLAYSKQQNQHYYDAELYRLKAEVLLQDAAQATEAERQFEKALMTARQQNAKLFELRATTGLARLWQSQNKHTEAYALLAPVYGWFTEGFNTVDLINAKSLLDELGAKLSA